MAKGTKVWIVVILLLAVGLFYVYRARSMRAVSPEPIFERDKTEVHRVAIRKGGREIELVREDGEWRISGNDTLEVRPNRLDGLFNRVLKAKRATVMTERTDRWATYSVDDSTGTRLKVMGEGGVVLGEYVFGQSRSDWSKSYVRIPPDPTVYLADENVTFQLDPDETFWGEAPKAEEDDSGVEIDASIDTTGD